MATAVFRCAQRQLQNLFASLRHTECLVTCVSPQKELPGFYNSLFTWVTTTP